MTEQTKERKKEIWVRKELRKNSMGNLKKNYWACIGVCFLMLIFSIEYTNSAGLLDEKTDLLMTDTVKTAQALRSESNGSELARNLIGKSTSWIDNDYARDATRGVMATLANGMTQTSHFFTFIGDAVNKRLDKSPPAHFLVSILGAIFSLAYYMFFQVQLKVGERRFFLESRLYHDTRLTRMFYLYETTYVWNVAKIMLLRAVFWLLWCFTIVGGVMKIYEYRAIAYILAERPDIGWRECFALAKEMTYGYKWEMFKFDLSYILWFLLGSFTAGLASIFLVNPLYRGGQTETMVKLREYAKAAGTDHIHLLDDEMLFEAPAGERLVDVYPTIKIKKKHELAVPWNRKYSIVHVGLIFFAFAMIGWCWEVFYHFVLNGDLVNRGSLWGPWIPIYGVGGACVVVFLKKLGDRPPLLALLTFICCGIIEYSTGWYFDNVRHIKFWDYTDYLFNLNGYICLEGLIMFTILASLGLYIIAPRFDNLFKKFPNSVKVPVLCVLSACFLGDITYTHFHPHAGKGITSAPELLDVAEQLDLNDQSQLPYQS
ncbi:MAG: DUF975 family protein [Bacillota bacterium]|nr:DUF975 family protein [Bacillota bacterium]